MSDGCCENGIDASGLETRHRRALASVLAINVAAFLVMVVGALGLGLLGLLKIQVSTNNTNFVARVAGSPT